MEHPGIKKAIEFYEPLVKAFCADEIVDKKDLYKARDDRMEEMGLHKKRATDKNKKRRKKKGGDVQDRSEQKA